ncbi:hypothetical protein BTW00_05485 [Psychrobacter sp. C 20.9]|uniref:hypothetical protein n=1 Tax=Psychrobacter sp. C 20.9 TaxID=1926477 RepID=UPI000946AD1F|nr:hypothetical protein [Psychrobacter sp. C 20.9]OLF36539.1 hypothetical protein BTW00_05485 [Psychrobacter sp. C 20.9]
MSEYSANNQLSNSKAQAKQDTLKAQNIRYDFELNESRKRANEIFWRGVMRFITHITLVSIVVYALFHFA